jgi:hypothetical protein
MCGSTLPKAIRASGLSAAAWAISSLGTGGTPIAVVQSTVKTTAIIFRDR